VVHRQLSSNRRTLVSAIGAAMIGAVTAGAALLPSAALAKAEYTIRFSHVEQMTGTVKGQSATKFKEYVEEKSNGRIKVQIYPNSELFGDSNEMQALQSNSVQMILPSTAKFTTVAKTMQVFDLPYLFNSIDEAVKVLGRDASQNALHAVAYDNPDLKAKGFHVLGFVPGGFAQLTANKPLNVPSDLKGLTIRVQPSKVLERTIETWGGDATNLAYNELYNALQQGVVDGEINNYTSITGPKLYEVQKYLLETNESFVGFVLTINRNFFNGLPQDLQKVVEDASNEVMAYSASLAQEIEQKNKQLIIDSGKTKVTELTDAERKVWQDLVVPAVWNEFRDQLGSDLIDNMLSERKSGA